MALAIRFERLLREGVARDYADLARLGGVTRTRITQIMNMRNLATSIPRRNPIPPRWTNSDHERALRQLADELAGAGSCGLSPKLRSGCTRT